MSDRFWPLCQIVGWADTHKLLDCAGPFSAAENVEEEKKKRNWTKITKRRERYTVRSCYFLLFRVPTKYNHE